MNKTEYSRADIACTLRLFNNFISRAYVNRNVSFEDNFKEAYKYDIDDSYDRDKYFTTIYLSTLFFAAKYYSTLYDNYFKYLREDKIEEINIPDEIFVNPSDRRRFSKKQIIKNIRDSLNHNDVIDNYKVVSYGNTIYYEINKPDATPIPFHVLVNPKDLFHISNALLSKNTFVGSGCIIDPNSLDSVDNMIDKCVYRKYYSKKQLKDGSISRLTNLYHNDYDFMKDKDDYVNRVLDYKDFTFSISQKNKIKNDYNYWLFLDNLLDKEAMLRHCTKIVMPLSIEKIDTFIISSIFYNYLLEPDKSFMDIAIDTNHLCLGDDYSLEDKFKLYLMYKDKKDLYFDGCDVGQIYALLGSIYYSYMFDNIITDPIVDINNKQYERRHLRNGFVHLRWFQTEKSSYRLFDWGNSMNAEFNPADPTFWKGVFRLADLIKTCNTYLDQYMRVNNLIKPKSDNKAL